MTDLEKKEYQKKYYENNKEKIKEKTKEYKKKYNKEYYKNNKSKIIKQQKEYCKTNSQKNKQKINNRAKEYYKKNIDKTKEYYKNNKQQISEKRKEYYKNNKQQIFSKHKEYKKNKRAVDPIFKLRCNIEDLIRKSIARSGYTKNSKTFEILGCTFEEFKLHLERQFIVGMNWGNRNEWHLDHIYPVSLAKDEADMIKLNHYTNFQPLWAADNLIKGNKVISNTQIKLI